MFELIYTIVFLICFIAILPILIFYAIKQEKERKELEKEYIDILKAINEDIKYIRTQVENAVND